LGQEWSKTPAFISKESKKEEIKMVKIKEH
jgi:hypothetical protein